MKLSINILLIFLLSSAIPIFSSLNTYFLLENNTIYCLHNEKIVLYEYVLVYGSTPIGNLKLGSGLNLIETNKKMDVKNNLTTYKIEHTVKCESKGKSYLTVENKKIKREIVVQ